MPNYKKINDASVVTKIVEYKWHIFPTLIFSNISIQKNKNKNTNGQFNEDRENKNDRELIESMAKLFKLIKLV